MGNGWTKVHPFLFRCETSNIKEAQFEPLYTFFQKYPPAVKRSPLRTFEMFVC